MKRKHTCDICGNKFKTKSGLLLHQRIHKKHQVAKQNTENENLDENEQKKGLQNDNSVKQIVSQKDKYSDQNNKLQLFKTSQSPYKDRKKSVNKQNVNVGVHKEGGDVQIDNQQGNVVANNDFFQFHRRGRRAVLSWKCNQCNASFDYRRDLNLHNRTFHNPSHSILQRPPWFYSGHLAPWQGADESVIHPDLQAIYEKNKSYILDSHYTPPVNAIYNFPVDNTINNDTIMEKVKYVFDNRGTAFRLNLSFGLILKNTENNELVYFRPYRNSVVFLRSLYISRAKHLDRLKRRLHNLDILQYMLNQRPNTKYKPVLVTNLRVWVWDLDYPLLGYAMDLRKFPRKLRLTKSLQPFIYKGTNRRSIYRDQKCAFRCLTLHRHKDLYKMKSQTLFENKVNKYLYEWLTFIDITEKEFKGVKLDELKYFEKCFKINIDIYEKPMYDLTRLIYKSNDSFSDHMDLHIWGSHLSYIYNLDCFTGSYECSNCFRLFYSAFNLKRHQKINCSEITKYVFKGGFYDHIYTVFDSLELLGIFVDQKDRIQKDFIVFDFESILDPHSPKETEKMSLYAHHVPVSVAICGTLPEQRAGKFILNDNVRDLIREWITSVNKWADEIRLKTYEKLGWVLEKLQRLIDQILIQIDNENTVDMEIFTQEEIEFGYSIESQDIDFKKYHLNELRRIYKRMKTYIDEVILLSFNSSRYDINLVKQYLPLELDICNNKDALIIKKANSYNCICTGQLRILDVIHYLAPGTSYDKFLKAYDIPLSKQYFPYEHLSSFSVLSETTLPPPMSSAWYSKLKCRNVLGDDDETIIKNYKIMEKAWNTHNMKNLGHLLAFYNLMDVIPMIPCIEKMQLFYSENNIDLFKDGISLPGIGRVMLHQSARKYGVTFSLFDKKNSDLYALIRSNITGGPSVIFRRKLIVGTSFIKNDPSKIARSVVGWDCNSMYAHAMSMRMPTGSFIRRWEQDGFKPHVRDRYMLGYYWMDYMSEKYSITIHHKLNSGNEFRCGIYLCDGWSSDKVNIGKKLNKVKEISKEGSSGSKGSKDIILFEFAGCFIHGHSIQGHACPFAKNLKEEDRILKWQRHLNKMTYLNKQHEVILMYECQFMKEFSLNDDLRKYVQNRRPEFYRSHRGRVSMQTLLKGVTNGSFYGMMEIDLRVPDEWSGKFKNRTETPYEYFSEMSPIFCTTEIPFEAIGNHMQEHVIKHNLSKKPRTLLVGGMKAKKILLASELIRWYLNEGLEVTHIYQAIEYTGQPCFSDFVDTVKCARREASLTEEGKTRALTLKLLCNSSYGGLLMQQCKHKNVKFVQGAKNAKLSINDRRFSESTTLSEEDQVFEISSFKRQIKMTVPIHLGFFILQYAKLILLKMYYNFLKPFICPNSFCLLQVDTDSYYVALSEENLIDVIRPEKKEEFYKAVYGSCSDSIVIKPGFDNFFLTRDCCDKHRKYDSCECGMWKQEHQGAKEVIGLSSKSYLLINGKKYVNTTTSVNELYRQYLINRSLKLKSRGIFERARINKLNPVKRCIKWIYKLVSKGVSKRHIKNPVYIYRHVIATQQKKAGVIHGIRLWDNNVYSYIQHKDSFSYLYIKRVVDKDGSSTTPLPIVLTPVHRPLGSIPVMQSDNEVDNVLINTE